MEIGADLLAVRKPRAIAQPGDLTKTTSWSPDPAQLDDLELLMSGALAPLAGYLDRHEASVVSATGRLRDGRPAPLALTLRVPDAVVESLDAGSPALVLEDPEGLPLARLEVRDAWPQGSGWCLGGPVTAMRPAAHGTFRRLRVSAAASRAACPRDRSVLGVPVRFPLLEPDLQVVREEAGRLDADVLLLPLVGTANPLLVGADGLVRCTLEAAAAIGGNARVVAAPVALHPEIDTPRRTRLHVHVAAAYGATHVLVPSADGEVDSYPASSAHHVAVVHRPAFGAVGAGRLRSYLDCGEPFPAGLVPDFVELELRRARPPLARRGVTILFTGLSGSGKSTVARGVYDALAERGDRAVTLLDGDVVRRMLSAGLGFSRADRDLNVRRIGFVAAQISRHGGIVLCAPIAPYADTRAAVREMAEEAGEFVLVHVAAPLDVCERRDRKGLYAKARAGLVPSFTGVSDPYEEPADADLTLRTDQMEPAQAVDAVIDLLVHRGLVAPGPEAG